MTAPQPSTPEEFAGDCDCPYPRHQSMCSACKLAARIRERDAALLAPLRAEVKRLREALRPFDRVIKDNVLGPQRPDGQKFTLAEVADDELDFDFTVGDFRAAARALSEGKT